jgi:hypothetical protein
MKAIMCVNLVKGEVDIYSPGIGDWMRCICGRSAAQWVDRAGTLKVAAKGSARTSLRVMGLHNQVLAATLQADVLSWKEYRSLHSQAVAASEGFIFDANRAACWAAVFRVGETRDVIWASPEETVEVLG